MFKICAQSYQVQQVRHPRSRCNTTYELISTRTATKPTHHNMTLKLKLSSRRDKAANAAVAEAETQAQADQPTNIFAIVSGAFQEVVSMAEDMHTIIVADEDALKKKREEEEAMKAAKAKQVSVFRTISTKRSSSRKKQIHPSKGKEEKANAKQPSSSKTKEIEVGKNKQPTSTNIEAKPVGFLRTISMKRSASRKKQINPSKEEIANTEQPSSSNTEVIRVVKNEQPNMETKESTVEEITEEPSSSEVDVTENPDNLAKLTVKLDQKEKQLVKLKQQLSKAEGEAAEAKQIISDLSEKYSSYLYGDNDQSQLDQRDKYDLNQRDELAYKVLSVGNDWLAEDTKQRITDLSANYVYDDDDRSQSDHDDRSQSDDEDHQSESDDEDQSQSQSDSDDDEGYDASEPTFEFSSKSMMYLSGIYSEQ